MFLATLLLLFSPPFPVDSPGLTDAQSVPSRTNSEETVSTWTAASALPDAPLPKVNSESISLSITAAADPLLNTPVKPAARGSYETARERKFWYSLVAVSHTSAVFDAYTTRRAISGNYGAEADPVLRPFAHSDAMYFATQVTPTILDYLGHRMMTSEHSWMRRVWWVPQAASASVSVAAGIHNYRLVP